nr:MAG TPA: hypothetical protein [Caudoviricetes sp.]
MGCRLSTCPIKCPVRSELDVHVYDGKRKQPFQQSPKGERKHE